MAGLGWEKSPLTVQQRGNLKSKGDVHAALRLEVASQIENMAADGDTCVLEARPVGHKNAAVLCYGLARAAKGPMGSVGNAGAVAGFLAHTSGVLSAKEQAVARRASCNVKLRVAGPAVLQALADVLGRAGWSWLPKHKVQGKRSAGFAAYRLQAQTCTCTPGPAAYAIYNKPLQALAQALAQHSARPRLGVLLSLASSNSMQASLSCPMVLPRGGDRDAWMNLVALCRGWPAVAGRSCRLGFMAPTVVPQRPARCRWPHPPPASPSRTGGCTRDFGGTAGRGRKAPKPRRAGLCLGRQRGQHLQDADAGGL